MMTEATYPERRPRKHIIGNSGRLKTSKVTVGNDFKAKSQKTRKGDTDIVVESPEFKLLARLYVPVKFLIRNNKVSRSQLSSHLPIIVNESLPQLNFELHIFLSSIVTSYISSWYLTKLNTDNFEFLQNVYELLCDFVKDIARRILNVVELYKLLGMLDDMALILDSHMKDASIVEGVPVLVSKRLLESKSTVYDPEDLKPERIVKQYLQESHVVFDPEPSLSLKSNKEENENAKVGEESRRVYLRVVVRNILLATFENNDSLIGPGPTSSTIAQNLVTIILADLVLEKVVTKLATPQFLLQTVAANIAKKAEKGTASKNKTDGGQLLITRLKGTLRSVYFNVSTVVVSISQKKPEADLESPSLFHSSVGSLADTITNFSGRKPVLYYIMCMLRSAVMASSKLSNRLEVFGRSFLSSKIVHSSLLEDANLARIVIMINSIVFDKNDDEPPQPSSLDDVTNEWVSLLQKASGKIPLLSLGWYSFTNEEDNDMRNAIRNFFSCFNYNPETGPELRSEFEESSGLNQLLVVKLLDSLVKNLYPELECLQERSDDQ